MLCDGRKPPFAWIAWPLKKKKLKTLKTLFRVQNRTPAPGDEKRMSRGRGAPSRAEPSERYGVAAAPFVGGFTGSR